MSQWDLILEEMKVRHLGINKNYTNKINLYKFNMILSFRIQRRKEIQTSKLFPTSQKNQKRCNINNKKNSILTFFKNQKITKNSYKKDENSL